MGMEGAQQTPPHCLRMGRGGRGRGQGPANPHIPFPKIFTLFKAPSAGLIAVLGGGGYIPQGIPPPPDKEPVML